MLVGFGSALFQKVFRNGDQEAQQQGIEQHDGRGFALLACEIEHYGQREHQCNGHTVGPPRQIGQVAVKDEDCGEQVCIILKV